MESGKTPSAKTLQLHKPVNMATPAQSCANRLKRKSIGTLKKRNPPEKRSNDSVDSNPSSSVFAFPPIAREGATKMNSSLSLSVRKPVSGALTRSNNVRMLFFAMITLQGKSNRNSKARINKKTRPLNMHRIDLELPDGRIDICVTHPGG